MPFRTTFSALLLIGFIVTVTPNLHAQTVSEPQDTPAEWSKPYAPFRIAGNLYYVGTYDLACYLVATPKGHMLINTGLANSEGLVMANIQALGFKPTDVKILLTTQAHYDHMGAMAALKKRLHAKVYVNTGDAAVMRDGGSSDYALGNGIPSYAPVVPDKVLHDGSVISLGGTNLTLLNHPGHTKGSCSYMLTTHDSARSYRVLIANMPTIVTDKNFAEIPTYPAIQADYATTLKKLKGLRFDIWLTSHASQFGLNQKHQPGDAYNPAAFVDPLGYAKALANLQQAFDKKVKADEKL